MMSDLNEKDIQEYQESKEDVEFVNPLTRTTVAWDLNEWSRLITELCDREKDLYKVKEEYNALSEKIIAETDFKALYGKNNESVRKQHVKSELSDMYDIIKAHEFSIDYCKRRISYLKSLIRVKSVIMEVKE